MSGITHCRVAFCRWVTEAVPSTQRAELPSALGLFYLPHLYCSEAAPDHWGEVRRHPSFLCSVGSILCLPAAIFSPAAWYHLLVCFHPPPPALHAAHSL